MNLARYKSSELALLAGLFSKPNHNRFALYEFPRVVSRKTFAARFVFGSVKQLDRLAEPLATI
jgi:hypothetical protein